MHRSVKDLIGSRVVARDGKAGRVADVLFGDRRWRMRYLDVETKPLFRFNIRYLSEDDHDAARPSRVLIAPEGLEEPRLGPDRRDFPARLSRDEVKACPSFASQPPAEEQYEREFRRYFRHGIYDMKPSVLTPSGPIGYRLPDSAYEHDVAELREHVRRIKEIAQEHAHSAKAVIGYDVVGSGGERLGVVSDLILNTRAWAIEYLVLDTRVGLRSRKHLIQIDAIAELDWSRSAVRVSLGAEEVGSYPQFIPAAPVNHDDARGRDFDYYGKPCEPLAWPMFY